MAGVLLLAMGRVSLGQSPQSSTATASADVLQGIATDAYVYFYPLVTMDLTRRQMTNLDSDQKPGFGPMNEFHHIREYPTADMKVVVRPNFDTLYSIAWLDLTQGPMIVSVPNTKGRYYLMPLLDMWTDVFAVPGKRTTGTKAGRYVVSLQGWQGSLRQGAERIESPTPYIWIIARTQTNGPNDYAAVHKVQDGFTIVSQADWDVSSRKSRERFIPDPTVDMKMPPLEQVNAMPGPAYFQYAAELMKLHPPHVTDWSIMARMKRIGIEPGVSLNLDRLSPAARQALEQAPARGLKLMRWKEPTLARQVNGWSMNTDTMGVYGNYYLKRAIVTMVGLGANQPDDAIYPMCIGDAEGKPLSGDNKYVLHFNKDELPPVGAFWSVTMYDAAGFPVANPINRFAVSSWMPFAYNPDGSLDLYFQHDDPGTGKEANWLPAGTGPMTP